MLAESVAAFGGDHPCTEAFCRRIARAIGGGSSGGAAGDEEASLKNVKLLFHGRMVDYYI
jgi:hypothetical protein